MTPIMANSKDGQDHKDKQKDDHVQYGSANIYNSEVMTNVKFFKNLSNARSKCYVSTERQLWHALIKSYGNVKFSHRFTE